MSDIYFSSYFSPHDQYFSFDNILMYMYRRGFFVIVIVIVGLFIDLTYSQSKLHPRSDAFFQMDEFSPGLPQLLVKRIIIFRFTRTLTNIFFSILTWSIGIKTPYGICYLDNILSRVLILDGRLINAHGNRSINIISVHGLKSKIQDHFKIWNIHS